MSYMNDDCDPFGVPYFTTGDCKGKEKSNNEFYFKDLEDLEVKRRRLNQELYDIKKEMDEAKKQLKEKTNKYVSSFAEIECDKHCNWEIIVREFELSKLEKMKEDLNLKKIEVKIRKVEVSEDNYQDRIVIIPRW